MEDKLNAKKWNQKAKTFPRYFPNNKEVLDNLAVLESLGFKLENLKDKKIVDIGCGCGRYALQIAQSTKELIASDIAQNMLDILSQDAKTYNIQNIVTICDKWDEALKSPILENVDMAFASVTPALNNFQSVKATLEKFTHLAYIGWGRKRECAFLQQFFDIFNVQIELPVGTKYMAEYIDKVRNITPKVIYKEWIHSHTASFSQTLESIQWHLDMHDAKYDVKEIEKLLSKQYDINDQITYTTIGEQGFIYI